MMLREVIPAVVAGSSVGLENWNKMMVSNMKMTAPCYWALIELLLVGRSETKEDQETYLKLHYNLTADLPKVEMELL